MAPKQRKKKANSPQQQRGRALNTKLTTAFSSALSNASNASTATNGGPLSTNTPDAVAVGPPQDGDESTARPSLVDASSGSSTGTSCTSQSNSSRDSTEDALATLNPAQIKALKKAAAQIHPPPSLSRNPSMARYIRSALFVEDLKADAKKHHGGHHGSHHHAHVPRATRRRVFLVLGIAIGVALAHLFMRQTKDVAYMDAISHYFQDFDLASIVPSGMIPDEFLGNVSALFRPELLTEEEFFPGSELFGEMNYTPHYPVTMIPGIVSTGLESWSTRHDCSRKYFRKRMWGTTTMFRAVLMDKDCWISNMKLDPKSGLDPEGMRLRAAQGLEAADYFVPGYWIWGRIMQNLAAIGYDNNNMYLAAYDWRLSFANLENRDKYFSRLKNQLEVAKALTGNKNVLVSHSMGSLVMLYFFKWVESELGGKGGTKWVDDHVHTFVNIAGPLLGCQKTLAAVLSGEVRDTAQLGVVSAYALEKFFSRQERAELFRSWGGLSSMIPKGGNKIWGDDKGAPDDDTTHDAKVLKDITGDDDAEPADDRPSFGYMLSFTNGSGMAHQTMDESLVLLHKMANEEFNTMLEANYSLGAAETEKEIRESEKKPSSWANPLLATLPRAPNMKIYCLYGVGKPTERSYTYTRETNVSPDDEENMATDKRKQTDNIYIDTSVHNEKLGISYGIHHSDGDGTVPLMSNGYMCVEGWQKKLYNPGGVSVTTREYHHKISASPVDIRGGQRTADHVDILGNYQVIRDLLAIVSNRAGEAGLEETIHSRIKEFSAKVKL